VRNKITALVTFAILLAVGATAFLTLNPAKFNAVLASLQAISATNHVASAPTSNAPTVVASPAPSATTATPTKVN